MTNEAILKKLYELKELSADDTKKYIDKWIESTVMDIAEESAKNVGLGDGFKAIKKILSDNKKANPDLAYVLRTSKAKGFIITDNIQALHFKTNFDLPTTALQKDHADMILSRFEKCRKTYKLAVAKPTRAELDTICKEYKAMPKDKRGPYPLYDFGKNLPYCDASKLLNITACFPSSVCFVDKDLGANSPIYFKWEDYEGLLMPIRKN